VCACVVGMLVGGQRGIGEDSPAFLACRRLHALEVVVPEEGASKKSMVGIQVFQVPVFRRELKIAIKQHSDNSDNSDSFISQFRPWFETLD
jgi:hypothetical protein